MALSIPEDSDGYTVYYHRYRVITMGPKEGPSPFFVLKAEKVTENK